VTELLAQSVAETGCASTSSSGGARDVAVWIS